MPARLSVSINILTTVAFLLSAALFSGCAAQLSQQLTPSLTRAMETQEDLELLKDGGSALILTLEGLISQAPDNRELLLTGTRASASYALLLEEFEMPQRAAASAAKAKYFALELLTRLPGLADFNNRQPGAIRQDLRACTRAATDDLFWAGYGLAVWCRFQDGSPESLMLLPKIEQLMLRVVELDEHYYWGSAHAVLGFYYGSRPAFLGGNPEASKAAFEKALELGSRQFLPTQVMYAESYAITAFDREKYTGLLNEVLGSDPQVKAIAAANQLAKRKAARLLNRTDEIF